MDLRKELGKANIEAQRYRPSGGFAEKMRAARRAHAAGIVIPRPPPPRFPILLNPQGPLKTAEQLQNLLELDEPPEVVESHKMMPGERFRGDPANPKGPPVTLCIVDSAERSWLHEQTHGEEITAWFEGIGRAVWDVHDIPEAPPEGRRSLRKEREWAAVAGAFALTRIGGPWERIHVLLNSQGPITTAEQLQSLLGLSEPPPVVETHEPSPDEALRGGDPANPQGPPVQVCLVGIPEILWLRKETQGDLADVWLEGAMRFAWHVDSLEKPLPVSIHGGRRPAPTVSGEKKDGPASLVAKAPEAVTAGS